MLQIYGKVQLIELLLVVPLPAGERSKTSLYRLNDINLGEGPLNVLPAGGGGGRGGGGGGRSSS